jgi:siderophore synthetase component
MHQHREIAARAIMHDLVDALLQENVAGITERGRLLLTSDETRELSNQATLPLNTDEALFQIALSPEQSLLFRVRADGFLQAYRLSRLPTVLLTKHEAGWQAASLDPVALLQHLLSGAEAAYPNLSGVCEDLLCSLEHQTLALQASKRIIDPATRDFFSLRWLERLASLRDRPFHPTASARNGWSPEDYYHYSAQDGQSFALNWVAVRRDFVRAAPGLHKQTPAQFLLSQEEQVLLERAMDEVGASTSDFIPFPVHPWQMRHVLPHHYAHEWERGICVSLPVTPGRYCALSSVRSLVAAEPEGNPYHLKVPLGISTLGALRVLPPRYLENGQKGQQLLQRLIEQSPFLQENLLYCGEEHWWAFHDPAGDFFADKPGHLACQLRSYPPTTSLNSDLVAPMSALTVIVPGEGNLLFTHLLKERFAEVSSTPEQSITLFREICDLFIQVTLFCVSRGILPEVHGQNTLLLFREGHVRQVLLRDHDTIRIYPPWLLQAGLSDPDYTVKPGTRNTLINQSPGELLAYFQTLGLQVNLYAFACALRDADGISEALLWREIGASIEEALETLDLSPSQKNLFADQLFARDHWPAKLFLLPLLQREGSGGGSMPSAMGNVYNPLSAVSSKTLLAGHRRIEHP